MKKLAVLASPIRYVVLLIAWCLGASVWLTHAQESSMRTDIAALLEKHDGALNQHNLEGILALYAPSPKTVVLGTGPGEKFQGQDEIKLAYTEIFKDTGDYRTVPGRRPCDGQPRIVCRSSPTGVTGRTW
jgi:hypothetical protein